MGDPRHVLRAHVALFQCTDAGFGFAQVEEQLLLRARRAQLDHRPAAQNVFLNARADPPHRISGQTEALFRVKPLHSLHEAHIRLGNHFRLRQPIAAIAHGNLGRQTKVACDHLVRGLSVLFLNPPLGQHVLFFRLQERKLSDLLQIPVQTTLWGRCGKICIVRHCPVSFSSTPF